MRVVKLFNSSWKPCESEFWYITRICRNWWLAKWRSEGMALCLSISLVYSCKSGFLHLCALQLHGSVLFVPNFFSFLKFQSAALNDCADISNRMAVLAILDQLLSYCTGLVAFVGAILLFMHFVSRINAATARLEYGRIVRDNEQSLNA